MAISAALPRPCAHPWPMDTIPDPEVPERPTRRRFTAAYKVAILDAYEAATASGAKGAILRREGLYSSHITEWRRLRALGFTPLPSPVDLLGRTPGATGLRDFFRVRDDYFGVKALFRVGSYSAGGATVGLYVAELQSWGYRSTFRDRARRRAARAVVERSGNARALAVLVPNGLERASNHEIAIVLRSPWGPDWW